MKHGKQHTLAWPIRRFIAAGTMFALCPVLIGFFSVAHAALFPAYRTFSKALIRVQAALTGIVPVALWDILSVVAALYAILSLVWFVARRRPLRAWLATVCCALSAAFLLFVGGWALNHYAPPLSDDLNLEVGRYSTEELAQATDHYLEQAALLAPQVPRDSQGMLEHQNFYELARIAGTSYTDLAQRYKIFDGPRTPVKALLLAGDPLLYSGHIGIYFPPTAESGVPLNIAVADAPFTMCHEAAHRLAIASEEEANFAAFLACAHSADVRFAYAGYLNAFSYCYNALAANDADRSKSLVEKALAGGRDTSAQDAATSDAAMQAWGLQLVFADRAATREHYQHYEGKAKEVGTQANDAYLKTFGETEGVKSYGLVVDYLIAWHASGQTLPDASATAG